MSATDQTRRPESPAKRLATDTIADLDRNRTTELLRLKDIVASAVAYTGRDIVLPLTGYLIAGGSYDLGWEVDRDAGRITLYAVDAVAGNRVEHAQPDAATEGDAASGRAFPFPAAVGDDR